MTSLPLHGLQTPHWSLQARGQPKIVSARLMEEPAALAETSEGAGWPLLAAFVAQEERLGAAVCRRGPLAAWIYEFVRFGLKQAWACLFGGILLGLIVATRLWYPQDAALHRRRCLALSQPDRRLGDGAPEQADLLVPADAYLLHPGGGRHVAIPGGDRHVVGAGHDGRPGMTARFAGRALVLQRGVAPCGRWQPAVFRVCKRVVVSRGGVLTPPPLARLC